MAATSLYDQGLSHEEIKYREHFQRGMDFTKIELYRSARQEFREALSYKPDDEPSRLNAEACDQHIRSDAKKVYVIAPVVLAIIAVVIIFFG